MNIFSTRTGCSALEFAEYLETAGLIEAVKQEAEQYAPNMPQYFECVRKVYALAMSDVYAPGRSQPSASLLNWKFVGAAENVWRYMKSIMSPLYPYFPVQNLFLTFADPYKKVALLVEESDLQWDPRELKEQDTLLKSLGWKVYRMPFNIATTYEVDLLPEHLERCTYGEFEDDDQFEEYQEWKPRLSNSTLDGFLDNLKKGIYGQ